MHIKELTPKWRPPLALVIAAFCLTLVALPVIAVLALRLIDDQFVRETERNLHVQATLFAEAYAAAFEAALPEPGIGKLLSNAQKARRQRRFDPPPMRLNAALETIRPPMPDPAPATGGLQAPYGQIAAKLNALAKRARQRTLAGYLALDHKGRIIAASGSLTGSLAAADEVRAALSGEDAASLRRRDDQQSRHPLSSISRNTTHRVFVAQPVTAGERIIGAVLLSRTPASIENFLYEQRATVIWLALFMGLGAGLAGWVFWRLISAPIASLAAQSRAVAAEREIQPEPLAHYGVRELADLGASVLSMAASLQERSAWLETYIDHVTHELKSPTTAILGAAELLQASEAELDDDQRQRLAQTIHSQGQRMTLLLERLRAVSRARMNQPGEPATLKQMAQSLKDTFPSLAIRPLGDLDRAMPWSETQANIATAQLAQNALQHGASVLELDYDAAAKRLVIANDGEPIAETSRQRLFDPFFTTRRSEGGTGMGLAIASAIIGAGKGQIICEPAAKGAKFRIVWPD